MAEIYSGRGYYLDTSSAKSLMSVFFKSCVRYCKHDSFCIQASRNKHSKHRHVIMGHTNHDKRTRKRPDAPARTAIAATDTLEHPQTPLTTGAGLDSAHDVHSNGHDQETKHGSGAPPASKRGVSRIKLLHKTISAVTFVVFTFLLIVATSGDWDSFSKIKFYQLQKSNCAVVSILVSLFGALNLT